MSRKLPRHRVSYHQRPDEHGRSYRRAQQRAQVRPCIEAEAAQDEGEAGHVPIFKDFIAHFVDADLGPYSTKCSTKCSLSVPAHGRWDRL